MDSNRHTALFRACERGHTEVVVVLMNAGASWDLQDTSGRTCLHWAASGGHAAICSSLIHKGLPADSQDSGGYIGGMIHTPLHIIIYTGLSSCPYSQHFTNDDLVLVSDFLFFLFASLSLSLSLSLSPSLPPSPSLTLSLLFLPIPPSVVLPSTVRPMEGSMSVSAFSWRRVGPLSTSRTLRESLHCTGHVPRAPSMSSNSY